MHLAKGESHALNDGKPQEFLGSLGSQRPKTYKKFEVYARKVLKVDDLRHPLA